MDNRTKQANSSTIGVGSAVTITFLGCLPGREIDAAKRLCDLPGATVYRTYGEPDFAVVREFPDQSEHFQVSQGLGLSHSRTITAFCWTGLDGLGVTELRRYPLAGFCFLKLNPEWLADYGVRGEQRILMGVSELVRAETGVAAVICGTTGWYEAILFVCGHTVSGILRFTNELRRLVLTRSRTDAKHLTPCFQTTETVPGALLSQGLVSGRVELGPEVKIHLRARCYSWADSRVRAALSDLMGTPESVAGTDDFVVTDVRKKTLSSYAEALRKFRARSRHLLYSTSTSFILTDDLEGQLGETIDVKLPTPIDVNESDEKLQELRDSKPTLYQTLLETYALLNDVIFDCRKSAAVADLVPFAKEVLETYTTSKCRSSTRIRDLNDYLGRCLDLLRWGAQQRYLGTDAWDRDIGAPIGPGDSGGIHRVLAALALIPTVVMRSVGAEWTGFVTSGWTDDYKRFSGGVLNIGPQSVADPSTWFVILHEIGHEHGSQIDIGHHPDIRKALMNKGMYSVASLREVTELYAEVFACLFGFGGDFDQAFTQTWTYLKSLDRISANLPRYFLRCLMVNIFMVEESSHGCITDKADIQRLAVALRDRLQEKPHQISIDAQELESACSDALKLKTVLDVVREQLPAKRISWPSPDHDYAALQDGRILLDIGDPVQFLGSVPSLCQHPTFRQSTAIILSIWNAKMKGEQSD